MSEIWKPINDFEGIYEVSNLGRIKSLPRTVAFKKGGVKTIKGRIMKPTYSKGYPKVDLYKNNFCYKKLVHRIVATNFLPVELIKTQINHKNGIRDDNRVKNLEWCTISENNNMPLTKIAKNDANIVNSISITSIHILSGERKTFVSMSDAARYIGRHSASIGGFFKGDRTHVNGYIFERDACPKELKKQLYISLINRCNEELKKLK